MRKMRMMLTVLGTLLLGELAAVTVAVGAPGKLILTGTGSSIEVMKIMGREFQKKHPAIAVEVLPSIGSSGGIKAAREGRIDIGLSSRPLKPEERSAEMVEEPYGRSAFVFAAHCAVPDQGLTLRQIEEIFLGKQTAWRDGTPVRLVLRPVSDAYSVFLAGISPGMKAASERAHGIPGVFVGSTDDEAATQIEKTPGAFGVTSACLIAAERKKVKSLVVDGKAPTLAQLSSGAYPFAMTLHLVYRKDSANPAVREFVAFVFSAAGRKILTRTDHLALQRNPAR